VTCSGIGKVGTFLLVHARKYPDIINLSGRGADSAGDVFGCRRSVGRLFVGSTARQGGVWAVDGEAQPETRRRLWVIFAALFASFVVHDGNVRPWVATLKQG